MGRKDSGLRRAFFRHAASSASSNRSSSFLYALIGRITETGLPARVMISGEVLLTPMLELGDIIGILLNFPRSDIAGNAPLRQFVAEVERMQPGENCCLAKGKQLLLIDGTSQLQAETR